MQIFHCQMSQTTEITIAMTPTTFRMLKMLAAMTKERTCRKMLQGVVFSKQVARAGFDFVVAACELQLGFA